MVGFYNGTGKIVPPRSARNFNMSRRLDRQEALDELFSLAGRDFPRLKELELSDPESLILNETLSCLKDLGYVEYHLDGLLEEYE